MGFWIIFSCMKLHGLLFEIVETAKIISELRKMFRSNSRTGRYLSLLVKNGLGSVEHFYRVNKDQFDRIFGLADVTKFEYLDSGSLGTAFSLGDKVLKIELEPTADMSWASSRARAEKAAAALFTNPDDIEESVIIKESYANIGLDVPMIYDQGSFFYPPKSDMRINWVIMEEFERFEPEDKQIIADIIGDINEKIKEKKTLKVIENIENYEDYTKNDVEDLGMRYRLMDNWFKRLVNSIWRIRGADIKDNHGGNIGIRRIGPPDGDKTGYLVFFD